jgi:hypothetical protein
LPQRPVQPAGAGTILNGLGAIIAIPAVIHHAMAAGRNYPSMLTETGLILASGIEITFLDIIALSKVAGF